RKGCQPREGKDKLENNLRVKRSGEQPPLPDIFENWIFYRLVGVPAWGVTVTVDLPFGEKSPPAVTQPGPPPHAPAHGYRRKAAYRYYPDSHVYFDAGRRLYFYLDGGSWRSNSSLPAFLGGALGAFVNIEADHDKPYDEIDLHKAKYPPGQLKKQDKEKGWEKHKGKGHGRNKE
ncbi:MAG: hypothetical protein ACOY3Z_08010, partial [Thermodesulfobacteriota bacterium]